MKRIFFLVIFVNSFLCIYAQSTTYYNFQGDQALLKKDFQTALIWYSEGLGSCDLYSIQQLTKIWIDQPPMRKSILLPIRNGFDCLKTLAEAKKPEAMSLLRDFYSEGIGIEKDSVLANYWHGEWAKSLKTMIDKVPDNVYSRTDSSVAKTPRKSLFSNRFCSFLTYTYSPTMPFGFSAGIYFDKWGGYVSCRTASKPVNAVYECNNNGVPVIGIENPPYEFNRENWNSRMITGGLLYPLVKNRLFVSAGGGYGKRDYYREIRTTTNQNFSTGNKSEWCLNTEASYKGLTIEVGGMFIWKKLTMAGGVNSTKFKDLDVYFGLGLTF